MIEIYWLTRLDALMLLGVIMVVFGIVAFLFIFSEYGDFDDAPKWLSRLAATFLVIGTLVLTFVPSKKDALLILGVGGAIEYLEANETSKQLPDKCVKALEKIADEYLSDEK